MATDTTRFQMKDAWISLFRSVSHWESRGPVLFVLSSGIKSFAQMGTSLVAARLVLPEELGAWQSVIILQSYLMVISLGVPMALTREYAYHRGAGEDDKALHAAWVGLSHTVFWSVTNLLVVTGILLYSWAQGSDQKTLLALTLFSFPALGQPFSLYFSSLYRSGYEFGRLGRIQILESAYLILSLVLVYLGGWVGLFIRYASIPVIAVLLRYLWKPVPIRFAWNWAAFSKLARLGVKLLFVNYIFSLLLVADRTLIATNFDHEALGYYSLAIAAQTAITVLPDALNQIIYARMTYRYGQTKRANSLWRVTFLPVLYNAVLLLIPVIILYILIDPLIRSFLPNYTPGIRPAQLTLLAGYFMCLRTSGVVFTALNRMASYNIFMVFVLSTMYVLGWISIRHSGTIDGVAAAKVITMALLALGVNILAFLAIRNTVASEKSATT